MGKAAFYAVRAGRQRGVFTEWDVVKELVQGYPKPEFKKFSSREDAEAYLRGGARGGGATTTTAGPSAAPAAATAAASDDGPFVTPVPPDAPEPPPQAGFKWYAVRRGRATGVFYASWGDVRRLVEGFGGAQYRSFGSRSGAADYLGQDAGAGVGGGSASAPAAAPPPLQPAPGSKRGRDDDVAGAAPAWAPAAPAAVAPAGAAAAAPQPQPSSSSAPPPGVVVSFDGGSRGNPGRAGYGYVIADARSGARLFAGCAPLPHGATNNEAEYTGLVAGLAAASRLGARVVTAQGDSELVVRQVTGRYACKAPKLLPLLERARTLAGSFESFSIVHVPRESNAAADQLANLAMDGEEAVAAVGAAGAALGRLEATRLLAERFEFDGSRYVAELAATPSFIAGAASLISRLWDGTPPARVEAALRALGWTDATGGAPDRSLLGGDGGYGDDGGGDGAEEAGGEDAELWQQAATARRVRDGGGGGGGGALQALGGGRRSAGVGAAKQPRLRLATVQHVARRGRCAAEQPPQQNQRPQHQRRQKCPAVAAAIAAVPGGGIIARATASPPPPPLLPRRRSPVATAAAAVPPPLRFVERRRGGAAAPRLAGRV